MTDALLEAGKRVAAKAEEFWNLDIYDANITDKSAEGLRCKALISQITQANHWGTYTGNGNGVQWCGMFAFYCWQQAGGLDPQWLETYSQSTYRVQVWANYLNWDKQHPNAAKPAVVSDRRLYKDLRKPLDFVPQIGDIVIVGDGTPVAGDHITILMGYDPQTGRYDTISGNGGGVGPTGKSREGVSRRYYRALGKGEKGYGVMWLVRPGFGDLLAERP